MAFAGTEWTLHDNGPVYWTCPLLDEAGVPHLFSTRTGGVSEGCYATWNFATGTGRVPDSEEKVQENYAIAARLFGLRRADVCRTYQAHTDVVKYVGEDERGIGTVKPKFPYGVDGLVTAAPGLLLSVRTADCVPILLADPEAGLVGAVHAGWRGTASRIAGNAVSEMVRHGADPERILAAIGPCIGPECYEVGEDVHGAFLEGFREGDRFFRPEPDKEGKYLLDLSAANRAVLLEAGLAKDRISVSGLCTKCHPEWFFSHRVSGPDRGTMSAFITVPGTVSIEQPEEE